MEHSEEWYIGRYIYRESLGGRKGFDMDIDEDIWDEIYEDIGGRALECFNSEVHHKD